jgi:excinuclease ABC subunit C
MSQVSLQDKIKMLPTKPGVYQFKDSDGNTIYIGKARSLKHRVSSYFNKNGGHTGKTRLMIKRIADVQVIVVETELDALLLENNLIKQYQPRYNVNLKDDKTYPWLCIKKERFPRVFPTRTKIENGSEYFGPYASVKMMQTLLKLIRQLYGIRTCNFDLSESNIAKGKFKVCLEYHIGHCLGPCAGLQSQEDYDAQIDDIRLIIKGNIGHVIKVLKERMASFAERLEFEKAQLVKNKIDVLQQYQSKSAVVNPAMDDVDVFSVMSEPGFAYVNFMRVVSGAVIQSHTLTLRRQLEETDVEMLQLAIADVRNQFGSLAREILVSIDPQLEDTPHRFTIPQRGDKLKLLQLSMRNAKYTMMERHKQVRFTDPEQHSRRILEKIQSDLRLAELPVHIEAFDNSNFHGTNAVSACVVFRNAKPSKKDYRHFNVKTVTGPDDFATMREVVHRRYSRMLQEGEELPQLIVIDGGKGQLGAALETLDVLGLRGKIAIVGIAKRLEEIYYPGDSVPLYIDKKSETLRVLQHLRDEAHRFGITHHRNRRSKNTIRTALTNIPGVGPSTAQALLKAFKSVKGLKEAGHEAIAREVGPAKAQKIAEWLAAH